MPQKMWGKWTKVGVLKFIKKFFHYFFLDFFFHESLYYLLCSIINPIFGKNQVPEIWTKMLLAYQIPGIFMHLCLKNKLIKWPELLHANMYILFATFTH